MSTANKLKRLQNAGLGDHAYVGVYTSEAYQYLMSAKNRESQLIISKAYIGVLVPDGVAIKNARAI